MEENETSRGNGKRNCRSKKDNQGKATHNKTTQQNCASEANKQSEEEWQAREDSSTVRGTYRIATIQATGGGYEERSQKITLMISQ